jgi:hypothetical protein
MNQPAEAAILQRIRAWTLVFILGLVLSGATAIPLQSELDWLMHSGHPLCSRVWRNSRHSLMGRLVDCSFGLFGLIPLWLCCRWVRKYEGSVASPSLTLEPVAH